MTPEEKQTKAVELHLAGANYNQIADVLGYANRSGAYKAVQKGLKAVSTGGDLEEVSESELARLDVLLRGLWPRARKGDVQAVDRVLKIEERRALILCRRDPNAAADDDSEPEKETSLSDFERRLRDREQRASAAGGA